MANRFFNIVLTALRSWSAKRRNADRGEAVYERRLNLALCIVGATLSLARETDAAERPAIKASLDEDLLEFGAPPRPTDVHARQARAEMGMAEKELAGDYDQALLHYRNAAAEALWAGDWELAEKAYHGWRGVKARRDMQ